MVMIDLSKVSNTDSWREQREQIRNALLGYIGESINLVSDPLYEELDEDNENVFVPDTKVIEEFTDEREHVKRLMIEYFVSKNRDESKKVNAIVFVPSKQKKDLLPAVLCCPDLDFGNESSKLVESFEEVICKGLAKLGYITLIPNYHNVLFRKGEFGRRNKKETEGTVSKNAKNTKEGQLLEILSASLCVFGTWVSSDIPSIGVIGKGFGALQAILLTAMESVVQACVTIGPISQWKDKENKYNWIFNKDIDIIPELRKDAMNGKAPIDLEHIMALCAPSALLLLNPVVVESTKRSAHKTPTYLRSVKNIYEILGMPEALRVVNKKVEEDEDYITLIEDWLSEWL